MWGEKDLSIRVRGDLFSYDNEFTATNVFSIPVEKVVVREVLYYLMCILSLGLVTLSSVFFPFTLYRYRYRKCSQLSEADYIVMVVGSGACFLVSCHHITIGMDTYLNALPQLQDEFPQQLPTKPITSDVHLPCQVSTTVIEHFYLRFIYSIACNEFHPTQFDILKDLCSVHKRWGLGVFDEQVVKQRREVFGPARIIIPIEPFHRLISKEVFQFFYLFQILALALWIWDEYYQYAAAISVISVSSLIVEVVCIRKSQYKLQGMIKCYDSALVLRQRGPLMTRTSSSNEIIEASFEAISSEYLVPGDIVKIENNMVLMCDMLLVQGYAFVNESILTGETVPVPKTSLPYLPKASRNVYHAEDYSEKCMLYAGCTIVNTRNSSVPLPHVFHTDTTVPLALVIRVGFSTRQGVMLRSILHPRTHDRVSFQQETLIFLLVLSCLTTVGAILTMFTTLSKGLEWTVVLIRTLDTFTNGIPPSLTTTMAMGCTLAVMKLRLFWNIHCLSPSCVNVSGQVNTLVFDKTGTLTEDSLELEGYVNVVATSLPSQNSFSTWNELAIPGTTAVTLEDHLCDAKKLSHLFHAAIATCHSLMTVNTVLCGDPTEIAMLQSINCTITNPALNVQTQHEEREHLRDIKDLLPCVNEMVLTQSNEHNGIILKLVRRFEFFSALQRMSVIVWHSDHSSFYVFLKGSPEKIRTRCLPSSVPHNYQETLEHHTTKGRRVLAFAYKVLPINAQSTVLNSMTPKLDYLTLMNSLKRDEVEEGLHFLGLAVFINKLKQGTQECLRDLHATGVRCIMATGDNPRTALAVARTVGMVPLHATVTLLVDVVEPPLGSDSEVTELCWTIINNDSTETGLSQLTDAEHPCVRRPFSTKGAPQKCTTREIKEMLKGSDPRRTAFLITGTAFRFMKAKADEVQVSSFCVPTQHTRTHRSCRPFNVSILVASSRFKCNSVNRDLHHVDSPHQLTCLSPKTEPTSPVDADRESSATVAPQRSRKLLSDICLHMEHENDFCINVVSSTGIHDPVKSLPSVQNSPTEMSTSATDGESQFAKSTTDTASTALTKRGDPVAQSSINLSLFELCLRFCRVYARMSPDDKLSLVSSLRSLSFAPMVGMCGDSANDAAALRGADMGLSFSDKETSIAAPFICTEHSIASMAHLLRESRGALVNSFQCFKFITLYALLQLFSTLLLYHVGTNLTDSQYLWIDLCTVLPLTLAMAWTHSASKLSNRLPLRHVISCPVILSLMGQILTQIIFLSIAFFYMKQYDFYVPFAASKHQNHFSDSDLESYENTVVFLIYNAQNLILAYIMAVGEPWRKSIVTNGPLVVLLASLIVIAGIIVISPERITPLSAWLHIVNIPWSFRFLLLSLILGNILMSLVIEFCLVRWATKLYEEKFRLSFEIDDVSLLLFVAEKILYTFRRSNLNQDCSM